MSANRSASKPEFLPKSQLQRTPPSDVNPTKRSRSSSSPNLLETQLDDLQAFLNSDFEIREGIRKILVLLSQSTSQLNSRLDDVKNEIAELKNWRISVENNLDQVIKRQEDFICEIEGANREIIRLQEVVDDQTAEITNLKADVDGLENRQRRDNLVFYNVPSSSSTETWEESRRAIVDLCKNLNLHDIKIDRAHRIGKSSNTKTAPIVAKIWGTDARDSLLSKWKELKELSVGISEDFSTTLRAKRRFLNTERKRALAQGKSAKLKYDKLIVNDEIFVCNESCSELVKLVKKNL